MAPLKQVCNYASDGSDVIARSRKLDAISSPQSGFHVTSCVRYWPKADMGRCTARVRFRG